MTRTNNPGRLILSPAPISTRNQFGPLLNDMGLTGYAAEIGTHRAAFAYALRSRWLGKLLYCVDPWCDLPGYGEQAKTLPKGSGDREDDYDCAQRRLETFGNTVSLWRTTSEAAAEVFYEKTRLLDFVYLDGNHEPPYVAQDLELWWPLVRPGGILAGHDFICPGEVRGGWGQYIQPEVLRLAEREGVTVHLVVEEGGLPWSYFIVKGTA